MTFATEFPHFDAATMPHIPAGFDDVSWCNDACPSFLNEAAGLIIFVDFADPAQREGGQDKRFNLSVWDNGSTGEVIVDSDDWSDIQAHVLARRFAVDLKEALGEEDFAKMRLDNVDIAEGCCASHDYCDANMPMDEAFQAVTGHSVHDIPGQEETDSALWNAAWDIAKRDLLTATAEEVLTAEFAEYVADEGIEFEGDAMEMIMAADLTDAQRTWISDFIVRWEAMRAAEDEAAQ